MNPFIYSKKNRLILAGICFTVALTNAEQSFAKQVDKTSDNNHRQIAAVIPGMPRPITLTVPNMAPSTHQRSSTPIVQTQGRTTTITVPKSIEEAADAAWVAGNKFAKVSYQKVMEVWKWLAGLYKQNHSLPMATPVGSPYVQGPVNHGHQLYFTNEGRLKTVVKQ